MEVADFDDISFQTIKKFTMEDETLSQLVDNIRFGWNQKDVRLSEYNCVKSDLSLYDNVILYRNRILIPYAGYLDVKY